MIRTHLTLDEDVTVSLTEIKVARPFQNDISKTEVLLFDGWHLVSLPYEKVKAILNYTY